MKRKKKVVSSLEDLEQIWAEFQVYDKDEMNPACAEMYMKCEENEE